MRRVVSHQEYESGVQRKRRLQRRKRDAIAAVARARLHYSRKIKRNRQQQKQRKEQRKQQIRKVKRKSRLQTRKVKGKSHDISNELENRILLDYSTPGHPIAFSAPGRVSKYYNIPLRIAKDILLKNDAYSLHREYKRPQTFNPLYVRRLRQLIQADVIDIRALSQYNDNINFLALFIDVFSKKVWVYPMKRKTGKAMKDIMEKWLESLRPKKRIPTVFMTDGGREYYNVDVHHLLEKKKISHRLATGFSKSAVAERANKTIQILIYKYLSQNETVRYIDNLQKLVKTYNNRGHRSLRNISPNVADMIKNEKYIRAIHEARYIKIKRKKPTLTLGSTVRVKTDAKAISYARRAYAQQFKGEYFKIVRINMRLPIPLFYLMSMDTGEKIQGGFYANELSEIRGDVFKVSKILKERKRAGQKELYVSWKWFGEDHNSWIPAKNIVQIYNN